MKIKTFVIFVAILLSFPTKAFASNTTHVEILTSNIISLTSANIDVRIKSQGIVNESEYEIKVQVFDTQSENRQVKYEFGASCPCKGTLLAGYGGEYEFKGLIRNVNVLENPYVQVKFIHKKKETVSKLVKISMHRSIVFSKSVLPIRKLPFEATESSSPSESTESSTPRPTETTYNSGGGGGGGSTPTPSPSESIWQTFGIDGQPQTLNCLQNVLPIWDSSNCKVISGSNLPYSWSSENGKVFYYDGNNYVENIWNSGAVRCNPKSEIWDNDWCKPVKNDPGYFYTNTPKPKDYFKPIVITTAQYVEGDLPKELSKKSKKSKKESDLDEKSTKQVGESSKNQKNNTDTKSPGTSILESEDPREVKNQLNSDDLANSVEEIGNQLNQTDSTQTQTWINRNLVDPVTKFLGNVRKRLLSIFN